MVALVRKKYYWEIMDYGGIRYVEAKFLNGCLVTLDFIGYCLFLASVDVSNRLMPCALRMIAYWEVRAKAPKMTMEEAQEAHTASLRAMLDKLMK
jgi:hypothetical protein